MGLLDDAIREHLDLKRRRGADPTEVEREEQEVLGPVRQRVEATHDEHELEHEPLAHDEEPWDQRHVELPEEAAPLPPAPAAFDHEAFAPAPPVEPEPYGRYEPEPPPEPTYRESEPAYREPEPAPAPSRADVYEPPETAEYNIEEELEEDVPASPEPREGEEDVLEETPDFLQDTPDHDRLWFEQRPPRDFDFDG
jgi:hypothetical protein